MLFLASVLLHLAALSLNSVLLKKWLAKRMFWGDRIAFMVHPVYFSSVTGRVGRFLVVVL